MKNSGNNLEAYTLSEADDFIRSWESEAILYIQRLLYWEKAEAQTLYHDACILVLDQLRSGRIKSIAKGYLFRTCKYLGANNWRSLQREKKHFEAYCREERERYNDSIYTKYGINVFENSSDDQPFESQKALRAFTLLNKKCQKMITLKYIEGKTHEDIANDLDHINSMASAKTTLSRCIKYWKKIFKELS